MTEFTQVKVNKDFPTSLRLRTNDVLALRWIARRDGHDNVSAAVRKLVDQHMRTELGSDWDRALDADAQAVAV